MSRDFIYLFSHDSHVARIWPGWVGEEVSLCQSKQISLLDRLNITLDVCQNIAHRKRQSQTLPFRQLTP